MGDNLGRLSTTKKVTEDETNLEGETEKSPTPETETEVETSPKTELERFQDYLETQGLSYGTILNYSWTARAFMKEPISQESLNKFLRQHNNAQTRKGLRQYLRFINRHKELDILPLRGKKKKALKIWLSRQEIEGLAASMPSDTLSILVLLLFETGLRISACLRLKAEDFDLEHLKVRGFDKGNKEFEQCITQDLADALLVFMEYRELDQSAFLFGRKNAWKQLHKYGLKHLGKKVNPHVFRRSLAKYLHDGGMVMEEIATYLNHDLVGLGVTVAFYAPPDRERVHELWREIMEKRLGDQVL